VPYKWCLPGLHRGLSLPFLRVSFLSQRPASTPCACITSSFTSYFIFLQSAAASRCTRAQPVLDRLRHQPLHAVHRPLCQEGSSKAKTASMSSIDRSTTFQLLPAGCQCALSQAGRADNTKFIIAGILRKWRAYVNDVRSYIKVSAD